MWSRFWPQFVGDLTNLPSDLIRIILFLGNITMHGCRGIVFEFAQYMRSGIDQRLCTHQDGAGCKCRGDLRLFRQDLTPAQSSCHCPCQNSELSPEIRMIQVERQENREKRLVILHHYTGPEFMDHVYHRVAQLLVRAAMRRGQWL
jgi:hypothetical protein